MNTILNIYTQNKYGSDKFNVIAFHEPVIVATLLQAKIYCFYFLFFSVRNLKEVYEQVNALKITFFESIPTSTRGNWPQPCLIN